MAGERVCLIGSGPSGMAFLYHLEKLRQEGKANVPEVVCYEKAADWGGLWNYDWRTGSVTKFDIMCQCLVNAATCFVALVQPLRPRNVIS